MAARMFLVPAAVCLVAGPTSGIQAICCLGDAAPSAVVGVLLPAFRPGKEKAQEAGGG